MTHVRKKETLCFFRSPRALKQIAQLLAVNRNPVFRTRLHIARHPTVSPLFGIKRPEHRGHHVNPPTERQAGPGTSGRNRKLRLACSRGGT